MITSTWNQMFTSMQLKTSPRSRDTALNVRIIPTGGWASPPNNSKSRRLSTLSFSDTQRYERPDPVSRESRGKETRQAGERRFNKQPQPSMDGQNYQSSRTWSKKNPKIQHLQEKTLVPSSCATHERTSSDMGGMQRTWGDTINAL